MRSRYLKVLHPVGNAAGHEAIEVGDLCLGEGDDYLAATYEGDVEVGAQLLICAPATLYLALTEPVGTLMPVWTTPLFFPLVPRATSAALSRTAMRS